MDYKLNITIDREETKKLLKCLVDSKTDDNSMIELKTLLEKFIFVDEKTPKLKFTADDIVDKDRLEKMVKREALKIFNSPSARNGRDLETVEFFVRRGKVAELYLIENENYIESDKKWHDLKDDNGDYVEVKAYVNTPVSTLPWVERDLIKYRKASWNISKWYILFNVDDNGVYELVDKIEI